MGEDQRQHHSPRRSHPAKFLPRFTFGAVAQLGEHLVCNQGVTGSIPVRSTPSGNWMLHGLESKAPWIHHGAFEFLPQMGLNFPSSCALPAPAVRFRS